MEQVELPKHPVVQCARGPQGPPLGHDDQTAQGLQPVLVLPLILESLGIHRHQGHPEVLGIQVYLSLLLPQYQVLPWVLVVPAVQSLQEFLLYPFLLYRDGSQGAPPTGWVQGNLAGQLHPGLPFGLLLPCQDYPSNLDFQVGQEVRMTLALQDILRGQLVLLHP